MIEKVLLVDDALQQYRLITAVLKTRLILERMTEFEASDLSGAKWYATRGFKEIQL